MQPVSPYNSKNKKMKIKVQLGSFTLHCFLKVDERLIAI
jgi:hypothetical protein